MIVFSVSKLVKEMKTISDLATMFENVMKIRKKTYNLDLLKLSKQTIIKKNIQAG